MGTIIVVGPKLGQQGGQFLIGCPDLVAQPLLQGSHKAFSNPVRLWPMARDHHMHEALLAGELGKHLGRKMHTSITYQKLQRVRQQRPQRGHNHLRRHACPSYKQRHTQTLPCAVIGDHQNGDPGADERAALRLFAQKMPRLSPSGIFALAFLALLPPLRAQLGLGLTYRPRRLTRVGCWPLQRCRRPYSLRRTGLGCKNERLHYLCIVLISIGKDLSRIGWLHVRLGDPLNHQPPRRPAHGRQLRVHRVGGGDKAQVDVYGLSWGIGGSANRCKAPFFAAAVGASHNPASRKIRRMVLGLTSGTQPFALVSSSAMRSFPQSGWSWWSAMTCCAIAGSRRRVR